MLKAVDIQNLYGNARKGWRKKANALNDRIANSPERRMQVLSKI